MSGIRYICLSDIHLGQPDGILTGLNADLTDIDLKTVSPALKGLCRGLRDLIKANGEQQTSQTTLILAGDILEIALAQMNKASMVFQHFIENILPPEEKDEKLFDKIIYIPGNHDHHIWELGRETQYVENYLWDKKAWPGEDLEPPWHKSSLLQDYKGKDLPEAYYLNNLIHRYKNVKDYEFLENFDVSVAYPNLALYNENTGRCALFHHGHFVQKIYHLMTGLAMMLFPKQSLPRNIDEIETENFAWIDFFWSTMGRSGKVGDDVGNIYICMNVAAVRDRLVENLSKGLVEEFGLTFLKPFLCVINPILKLIAKKIVEKETLQKKPIKDSDRKKLEKYLAGPVRAQMEKEMKKIPGEINFIFGHTHMPYEDRYKIGKMGNPGIYNTGGWVVEDVETEPLKGAAAILIDDNLDVTSLRIYNEGDYQVRAQDAGGATPENELTGYINELLKKSYLGKREFSDTIADEVEKHKKFLNFRREQIINGKAFGFGKK